MARPKHSPARRQRDPRIDAFRGLALAMILVDHMPGNPYEQITLRNWGFSDAAEAFFIMSGVAAGIAYSGRFLPDARAEHGLWPAIAMVWKRAWTLYLTHIFLTAWGIAIFAAGALYFGLPELLETNNLRRVFEDTAEALVGIPLLGHQIGYVNILPVYSVLLFCTPVAIMFGLRRPWLLAGLSALLWFAAGEWRLNPPNYPNPGGWFFNPLAWQFIFVVGLLTGIHLRRGERFVPVSRVLFALAAGWLVLVLAWRYVPEFGPFLNHQMARLGSLGVPFNIVSHDKTFLAAPRLLHALALAYVLSCIPAVTRACAHRLASPLRLMGRHGLLVFSAGTLISLVGQVAFRAFPEADWLPWVLPLLGLAALYAAAWLADRLRSPRPDAGQPVRLPEPGDPGSNVRHLSEVSRRSV